MNDMTTAEQIRYIRRAVMYTLWRIATTDPAQGPTDADPDFQKDLPERLYSDAEMGTIQGHAESLFRDDAWIAEVVGTFAANQTLRGIAQGAPLDWATFAAAIDNVETFDL